MSTVVSPKRIRRFNIMFKKLNLVVNIEKTSSLHGYALATRQAWQCSERAKTVGRVIGIERGTVKCVIEGVNPEISSAINNPNHNESLDGHYIFLGGDCYYGVQSTHFLMNQEIRLNVDIPHYFNDATLMKYMAFSRLDLPRKEDLEEITALLPRLETEAAADGWLGGGPAPGIEGAIVAPTPNYNKIVDDLINILSKECWFDPEYEFTARTITNNSMIEDAGIHDIRAMLTAIIRGERFCDGLILSNFENGYIQQLLQRLNVILTCMR